MNTENQSYKANRSVGYNIQFEPDKPKAAVPKRITEYCSKPALSPQQLQEKQKQAAVRRKYEERARLARMHKREEVVRKLDELVRPYIDTVAQAKNEGK